MAQYFYLRVFDIRDVYLLNFVAVFVVAGIGADDCFLIFDALVAALAVKEVTARRGSGRETTGIGFRVAGDRDRFPRRR